VKRQNILLLFSFILICILSSYTVISSKENLIKISAQTIYPYQLIGDESRTSSKMETKEFQISKFVTLGEYKDFLANYKRDTTFPFFYRSPLPDSTMTSVETYKKYMTDKSYESYPALGISFENAMEFCKWKTLKDNPKDSITFIYRLPLAIEWLAAYNYLKTNKIPNDFNQKYSDWLMDLQGYNPIDFNKVHTFYNLYHGDNFDEPEYYKNADPNDYFMWIDRIVVMGNSYLYQHDKLLNCFSYTHRKREGYRNVSFRYIKENVKDSPVIDETNLAKLILRRWTIHKK